jgi:hypothetical protein
MDLSIVSSDKSDNKALRYPEQTGAGVTRELRGRDACRYFVSRSSRTAGLVMLYAA